MDADRVRAFVADDYRKVVAAVALVCGDRGLAEDAVQEALARAWEQEARGASIERLAAWVTTVAMNQSRTSLRRRVRERRAVERLGRGIEGVSDLGDNAGRADALAVRAAVVRLPRRQRQVVVLRYFLGYPVAEVASELGMAEGTAKALLHQARARLSADLSEPRPEPRDLGDTGRVPR